MGKGLTLGLSKIGDLLLNNKITITDSGSSLENIILTIPEYQRPYKWTAKNANQLLDDIEDARNSNKEVYRVGTLILHKNREGNYDIVDGQQRTITFSLLLTCLNQGPVDFLKQPLANNTYNLHNVMNNHKAFARRIDKLLDEKEIFDLTEYITEHCELIIVITDDLSEAFQFFDSQNARGKTLYPHDLLKAYHLREMSNIGVSETERIVKTWEEMDQKALAVLFNEYLYRLKEWVKGNKSEELTERNIEIFKGVTGRDNHPFAQYYKGAFAYADEINRSHVTFVTGLQRLNPFQINAPIIAGKPFFEYAKHYFDVLADIQNNDKYEGYYINDNPIVKTLDLRKYKNGVGNGITRLMFDTAILLYVDRFCPAVPSKTDTEFLDQFVIFAFVWAYSMRAQYQNVGWQIAQNYIMGTASKDVVNGFNIYKVIAESDSPNNLLSKMADLIVPVNYNRIQAKKDDIHSQNAEGVYENYLYYFEKHRFLED
ncbi:DUF262 domain-containing protein [Butyrivibrio sp.]|uniref:DUF262 domain-containing protein n=1 Tax=Butyrivibrio sp. TaxID=28121 RepID=UPI0025B96383|nr:DUF262 domain-containing protein [Butyrivibrio sp.]MBQ9301662.1 DUF262 domain-containing protein [Butyrivibrio sp.]